MWTKIIAMEMVVSGQIQDILKAASTVFTIGLDIRL